MIRNIVVIQKKEEPCWKKILKEVCIKLNIVEEGFTGQVILNFNQGGIASREKREIYK